MAYAWASWYCFCPVMFYGLFFFDYDFIFQIFLHEFFETVIKLRFQRGFEFVSVRTLEELPKL